MSLVIDHPYLIPSERLKKRAFIFSVLAIIVIGLSIILDLNPLLFFTDGQHLISLLGEMVPPNVEILWEKKSIFTSILETLAMAFLGTFFGGM